MKKKILIALISSVLLLFIFVVAISWNYNFMNFTSNSTKPYLLKATIIEIKPEEIVFSDIKPFVFFDASDVITQFKNRDKDLSLRTFNDPPESSDTFSIPKNEENNLTVGQEIWLKYYPLSKQIEF